MTFDQSPFYRLESENDDLLQSLLQQFEEDFPDEDNLYDAIDTEMYEYPFNQLNAAVYLIWARLKGHINTFNDDSMIGGTAIEAAESLWREAGK